MCVSGDCGEEVAFNEDRQDKEEKKTVVDDKVMKMKPGG